jgi:type IV pilus assembly protein PilQ
MILSVRLDDSNSLGVNFELLRDRDNVRLISGTPLNNLAAIDVSDGGLKFGFLDSSLSVFVDALETVGDTNVIASPRLMCLNKQKAEILIGSQLGYVSTTVTENAATQAIEFLEVGTQLRIRPFISSDGLVRMEVHPELSTGSVRVEEGFTLPDKEVTQVTTNIMCRDGCTVIIGGLIREDLGTTTNQIPWLGSLPAVGPLFRQKTETIDRREILVLLTPRIVHDPDMCFDGEQAGKDFTNRQAIYADKMSPIGKRHFGQRYLRMARSAWAAGDAQSAFRYVNLSIHFDPQSVEATNLRSDIIEAYPQFDQVIGKRLREGLPLWQRPIRDYSKAGYPWQSPDQPPPYGMEPVVVHEDPGSAGVSRTIGDK